MSYDMIKNAAIAWIAGTSSVHKQRTPRHVPANEGLREEIVREQLF